MGCGGVVLLVPSGRFVSGMQVRPYRVPADGRQLQGQRIRRNTPKFPSIGFRLPDTLLRSTGCPKTAQVLP